MPEYILFLDILLKFNMGYYEEGSIVTDRNKIVKNYFSQHFWIDGITVLSLLFGD
jgi:hypothetical protein